MQLLHKITNSEQDEDYDGGEKWRVDGIRLSYPRKLLYSLCLASLLHSILYYFYLDSPLHTIPMVYIIAYPVSLLALLGIIMLSIRFTHHCTTHVPFHHDHDSDLSFKHFTVFYIQQQYVYVLLWWAVYTSSAIIALSSLWFEACRRHMEASSLIHSIGYSFAAIYVAFCGYTIHECYTWRSLVKSGDILQQIPILSSEPLPVTESLKEVAFTMEPIEYRGNVTNNTNIEIIRPDLHSRSSSLASSMFSDDDLYADETFYSASDPDELASDEGDRNEEFFSAASESDDNNTQ